jgi:hypothetical protein
MFVMRISDERLDEFIRGYEAAFKEPLPRDDARIMATRLLELYRLFLRRPSDTAESTGPIAGTSGTLGTSSAPDSSLGGEP